MGGLDANLMFAASFEPEPQFAGEAFAAGEWIFLDRFIVRDGLTDLWRVTQRSVHGTLGLLFGQDVLAHFVFAQLQPLPPGSFWRRGAAFDKGHILALHGAAL